MLARLGRWLRAAGYDTVIAGGGLPDHLLAARCAAGDRVLLTKDRQLFAAAQGIARVLLVAGDGIDETALRLRNALDIDWQHAPFTRCIVDNAPLTSAQPELTVRIPERSRAAGGPVYSAPIVAVSIGREAMSAACSGGSRAGKTCPPRGASSAGWGTPSGRPLQAERLPGDLEELLHLSEGHCQFCCEFLMSRRTAELGQHLLRGSHQLVDRLDQVLAEALGHLFTPKAAFTGDVSPAIIQAESKSR